VNARSLRWVFGAVLLVATTLCLGCGSVVESSKLDPEVLKQAAQQGAGLSGEEKLDQVQAALADAYPTVIPREGRAWTLNDAEGAAGQVAVLYNSSWEYLIFVGSPVSADWSLGPYPGAEIRDFVLDGTMQCYVEGEFTFSDLGPGQEALLTSGETRSYRTSDGTWLLEYGRGNIPATLYADMLAPDPIASSLATGAGYLGISVVNELIRNFISEWMGLGGLTGLSGF